jgi:hypothetical protein
VYAARVAHVVIARAFDSEKVRAVLRDADVEGAALVTVAIQIDKREDDVAGAGDALALSYLATEKMRWCAPPPS